MISFRNMANKILSDLKKKENQTKMDVIEAAASFVKADIQEMESFDFYPTAKDIKDKE